MRTRLSPIELTGGTILSDEVYARIGDAILDGRLAPGQRLRDVDLATELGVSRTPVREALQRLERFGLVEIAVGRYTRVAVFDDATRRDMGVFTVYLMGNALRLALTACTDEELAGLTAAADDLIAAARSDGVGLFDANARLFEQVTHATGNRVFLGLIRETGVAIQHSLRGWTPFLPDPDERAAAYRRLRECIGARDADGAEQTLRGLHALA